MTLFLEEEGDRRREAEDGRIGDFKARGYFKRSLKTPVIFVQSGTETFPSMV